MGIDRDSEVEAEGSLSRGGQADFQRLIVIDSKDKTVRQLKIDRDTMAEVTVLGMLGNPVGTTQMQISLAHGFGDGKGGKCMAMPVMQCPACCEGENIDFYLAMSLDGISVLNDLAGGVTVTLEDDFSAADPAMTRGTTLTLHGDQAEIFCAQAHGYWRGHQRSPHGAAGGVSCTAFRTAGKQGAAGSAVHRTGVRCAAALSGHRPCKGSAGQ